MRLPPKGYAARRLRAWRGSLVVRLGAAMALVGVLAVASGAALLQFVDASAGKAAAINVAGSLRMRSYGIGLALLDDSGGPAARGARLAGAIERLEAQLHAPRLAGQVPPAAAHPMRAAYWQLISHWTRLRRQLAAQPASELPEPQRAAALASIQAFASEADALVAMLQADLEGRIERHKMLGSAALLLALAVLASSVWYARLHLARPLAELKRCSRAIRAGDFSARVGEAPVSEFADLSVAFNSMARELSQTYGALEARVREKTAELERTNRSLALLYEVAHRLSGAGPAREPLGHALRGLQAVLGVESVTVCTGREASVPGVRLAVSGASGCGASGCGASGAPACMGADRALVGVPLVEGGTTHGVLALRLAPGQQLAPWQRELADTVASHVAGALANASRVQAEQRVALLEERSVIARELHDSLAQSLSYLKIQVARLKSALAARAQAACASGAAPAAPRGAVDEVIDELKGGLDAAYRQLRELLTTFRLRMDGRGLQAALRDTVDEFARRSGLPIGLDHRLADLELTAHQEIHVLQTVREALANVERHARATRAAVTLVRDAGGQVVVTVDDDGVGIGDARSRPHHYGLAIMDDRADSLGGRCTVCGRAGGGTRVELRFPAGGGIAAQALLRQADGASAL